MAYQVETALKLRARGCGFTVAQLAFAINMPPPTLSNKLNGFSQLELDQRRAIEKILSEKEKTLQAAGSVSSKAVA